MQHTTQLYRPLLAFCILLSLVFCPFGQPNVVYAQETGATVGQLSAAAQQIANDLNQARTAAGLPPLAVHPLLNQAAQAHVEDMLANQIYGHTGSDGSLVRQRVQRVGYPSGGWASENWVAAKDPVGGMNWWMNDWIHRENILNRKWREVGVGAGVNPAGGMIFVTVFTAGQNPSGESVTAPQAEVQTLPVPAEGIDYTIQTGDTLLAIALRYGLDWTMIAEANRMNERSLLQIGQVLRLPGVQSARPVEGTFTPTKSQPAPNATGGQTYTVQSGDTLSTIALRFQLGWEAVAAANNLGEYDFLQIGQQIILPGIAVPSPSVAVPAQPNTYTVSPGDTMISIALRFDLDWQALLRLNGLTENSTLQIGQVLRLQ